MYVEGFQGSDGDSTFEPLFTFRFHFHAEDGLQELLNSRWIGRFFVLEFLTESNVTGFASIQYISLDDDANISSG